MELQVYRITKTEKFARDLSGIGAFLYGGRWNSKGTLMLYTSENSSLAYLETLVHFDEAEMPPDMFVSEILIKNSEKLIYEVKNEAYPNDWPTCENPENKLTGDAWMASSQYLGYKVRSAVNSLEHNFLLNPLHPDFAADVSLINISKLTTDRRLNR